MSVLMMQRYRSCYTVARVLCWLLGSGLAAANDNTPRLLASMNDIHQPHVSMTFRLKIHLFGFGLLG